MSTSLTQSVPTLAVPESADGDVTRLQFERFMEVLRPRLMGHRLAAALGSSSPTCHVLDAKYEPGVRAMVLYAQDGRLVRGDVAAGEPKPLPHAAGLTRTVDPGVALSPFPHDPELPALPQVMDPAQLGPALLAAMIRRPNADHLRRARRCGISVLRYRPGKRAALSVTFRSNQDIRCVAKVYHDPAKAAAVAREAPLIAKSASSSDKLRLAPIAAYLPEFALVAQKAVPGVPLDAMLSGSAVFGSRVRSAVVTAAEALAELHAHAVPAVTQRQRPVDNELRRFLVRADRIRTVDSEFAETVGALAHRLMSLQSELPPARTGLVHGDCKPSQFLVADPHAYLLDFDHCGVSDQTADVGTFLASLRQLATRFAAAGRSPTALEGLRELADAFLNAYLAHDCADLRARIRWQEAVALERKALRAFARAPRSPLANALVREGNRCLDELRGQDERR